MKLKYISRPDFLQNRHKKGLHVVVVHDINIVRRFFIKNGIRQAVELMLENIMLIDGKQMVFFVLPEKNWFLDVKGVCEKLVGMLRVQTKGKDVLQNRFYLHVDKMLFSQKRSFLLNLFKQVYQFKKYKYTSSQPQYSRNFYIVDKEKGRDNIKDIISHVKAGSIARDIATEPSNALHPEGFCDRVKQMFKNDKDIKVRSIGMQELKSIGLNLIASVGQGAQHEPRLMIIEYMPVKNGEAVCLVGKGVVFDSGGYNLKGSASMWGMKGDKTGGAVVVGIFDFLSHMKQRPNQNIVGFVPLVENLISHSAIKPGDIIKTYNGVTVEIIDTDAEGRLIMADTFAYLCDMYKPKYIVDFATLTGWSGLMHCDTSYVYYTQDNKISDIVQYIGEHVGERSVRMPVWPEYTKYTKSTVADYKNHQYACKRSGGFMASMFMMNFIKTNLRDRWLHFDITHSEKESLHTCNSLATGIDLVFKYLCK